MSRREDTYGASLFIFKIILFLIFGVFILIYKGFQALSRGDSAGAVKWFSIPVVLVCIILFQNAKSYSQGLAYQKEQNASAAEEKMAVSDPNKAFSFERVESGLEAIPNCNPTSYLEMHLWRPCNKYESTRFAKYIFTNNLPSKILQVYPVKINLGRPYPDNKNNESCMTSWGIFEINGFENLVHSGETAIIYCFEVFNNKPVTPCVEVMIYPYKDLAFVCDSNLEPEYIITEQAKSPTPTQKPKDVTKTPSPKGEYYRVINVTNNSSLNIRDGAGMNYRIIGKIPYDGKDIQVTGDGIRLGDITWVPIIYKGVAGWVSSYYLARQ